MGGLEGTAKPRVTILVPTYGRAAMLGSAVESALAQTYGDLRVLVVDDASPDETGRVVRALTRTDARVDYLRQPTNLGIAGNWCSAIAAATGDFFCILNDDDTIEPDFIEATIAPLLRDDQAVLAFGDHWVTNEQGVRLIDDSEANSRRWQRHRLTPGPVADFAACALVNRSILVGATLFRRRLVGPHFIDERAQSAVDIWLLYQCFNTGAGAHYVPRRLLNYRSHPGGMSQDNRWRRTLIEGDLFVYRQMLADLSLNALHPIAIDRLAAKLYEYGVYLLLAGYRQEARRALGQSLQLSTRPQVLFAWGVTALGPLGTAAALRAKKLRNFVRPVLGVSALSWIAAESAGGLV